MKGSNPLPDKETKASAKAEDKPKDIPAITVVKSEPPVELDHIEPGTGKFVKAPKGKAPDHAVLIEQRDAAQRAHAAAVQAQTLAEIEADAASRDFSTRFTEHMTTAPRTLEEIDAAYKLALSARDIAEEKANARSIAQAETLKALADYFDAYHAVVVDERKALDANAQVPDQSQG